MAEKQKNKNKKSKKWLITGLIILGIGLLASGVTFGMGILTIGRDLIPLTAGLSVGVPLGGVAAEAISNKIKAKKSASQTKTDSRGLDRAQTQEETLEEIPVELQTKTKGVSAVASSARGATKKNTR